MKKFLLSVMVLFASFCYADDSYVLEVLAPEWTPTTNLRIHGGGALGWWPDSSPGGTEEQYNTKPRLKYVGIEADGRKLFRGESPGNTTNCGSFKVLCLYHPYMTFVRNDPDKGFAPYVEGSPNTEGVTQRIEPGNWLPYTNGNLQMYLLNVNVKVPLAVTELYFLGPWGEVSESNPIEQAVRELILIETTAEYKVFQLTMGRVTHVNKSDYRVVQFPKYEDFNFVSGKFLCGLDMQYIQSEATEFGYTGDGTDVGAVVDGAAGNIEFDLSVSGFLNIPQDISTSLPEAGKLSHDIKVVANTIQVDNATTVEIYSLQGALLQASTASSFVSNYLNSGVYLVSINKAKMQKVIIH